MLLGIKADEIVVEKEEENKVMKKIKINGMACNHCKMTVEKVLNAIDGVIAPEDHWRWPYQSWGINRRDDAAWKLEFGRTVEMDKLVIYTRADFPHDNWWEKMTVTFSDGSVEVLDLVKGGTAQIFNIKKNIEWLEVSNLIKADDPSPFPALTQLQVYGRG